MDREKSIDESWKESAEKEKERLEELSAGASGKQRNQRPSSTTNPSSDSLSETTPSTNSEVPEESSDVNFLNYVTNLAYQVMVFLGEIPNPVTNEVEIAPEQAKFFIDTLIMLRNKTKGNLSKQESDTLSAAIYELQMKYIEVTQRGGQR